MEERYLHSLDEVPLNEIVKDEYRTYQIYTLMDRAIPYLQDGLKPGQRRILYTLWKYQSKGLQKVSSATGLVLTLHPHGPASVETAIVNMAQDYTFANNYPIVDKKGYFGERMETNAAASRYIECKLGEVAKLLLFDDMNQVEMVPNYDEKVMEPLAFLPKLPMMLLNGAEGIGTGFSSVIPSFHHKDLVDSIIQFIKTGKCKKISPYFHNYNTKYVADKKTSKLAFNMVFEEIDDKIFITEIPRNYDAKRVYAHLGKFIEEGYLKDFIDSSVENTIRIELIFKRNQTPSIDDVRKVMKAGTTLSPNFTLISERGVKIFSKAEEILEIFAVKRLEVVKRRYELLCEQYENKITQNNEIIRFIRQKHYEKATKLRNRKEFVEYLNKQKFTYSDYLADMAIYRMTKDEVEKRKLMVKDDTTQLKRCAAIAKSPTKIKNKLIEELTEVKEKLTEILKKKDKDRNLKLKALEKEEAKRIAKEQKLKEKAKQKAKKKTKKKVVKKK